VSVWASFVTEHDLLKLVSCFICQRLLHLMGEDGKSKLRGVKAVRSGYALEVGELRFAGHGIVRAVQIPNRGGVSIFRTRIEHASAESRAGGFPLFCNFLEEDQRIQIGKTW